MNKVYLAHSISTRGEFEDSKRVAERIRSLGYDVYAPAENNAINDKANEPTPVDIYNGDVDEIMNCDIFVVNINGGHQDGTISEVGVVAGINERVIMDLGEDMTIPIIAYTSNARLAQPQHYHGMASASANHLVLGMIDRWGEWVGTEDVMISELSRRTTKWANIQYDYTTP